MEPSRIAENYDRLALFWQQTVPANYGVEQLKRAIRFTEQRGHALDVGCGSHGRFIEIFHENGFSAEGVDISQEMIALARERRREATFHLADICEWKLPRSYQLISAWDSTFHLPSDRQEPVLRKLCRGLANDGVLIFTCGGGSASEISGTYQGEEFGYSTLGVEEFVRILAAEKCFCRHVEYDQYPEKHVYLIAQKF